MSYEDNLNERLLMISYYLTTEEITQSRIYRDWERFNELGKVDRLHLRLEELTIYEDKFEGMTEDDMSVVLNKVYESRFK